MKTPRILAFLIVVALLALAAAAPVQAQCLLTPDGTGVQCQTLYAGQTIPVGTVCARVEGDKLLVTYSTMDCWQLLETHLWVGRELGKMPATKKGNPKVGLFPYASGDITGASEHTEVIPLTNLGIKCPDTKETLIFVAAHAALRCVDGDGNVIQTETGWGDGSPIVDKGNWATYFEAKFSCDCKPGEPEDCETAFAAGKDYMGKECFLNIDVDGDGVGDFDRWGWSLYLPHYVGEKGTASFPLYAGAGQCEIGKGTQVGYVDVVLSTGVDGQFLSLTTVAKEPYTLKEIHLYAGCEVLPRNVNGEFTVAPGQYPVIKEFDGPTTVDKTEFKLKCSKGPWIVVHAVVCGF